jgi:hypothetical protein
VIPNLDETSTIAVTDNQISAELAQGDSGEIVILSLDEGIYYELNEVGARIWNLIQQPCSVKTVRDALLAEFDVETKQCEEDLLTLLRDLIQRGLAKVIDESLA